MKERKLHIWKVVQHQNLKPRLFTVQLLNWLHLKGAKIQYVTVQNWSNNVFNLVTKRAIAEEEAEVRWIDCNIGSRLTMKYPGVILRGRKARGEVLSIALANNGQHQDTGAKMIHAAEEDFK